MTKCNNCNKNITKTLPGLECSKCGKVVHASQTCAGLSAKQLSVLRNSDGIEWSCEECKQDSPGKSSFIIPEEKDEEDMVVVTEKPGSCNFDINKFINHITEEMKNLLNKELHKIQVSINTCTNKVEDLTQVVITQNGQIKELQSNFVQLKNRNIDMAIKIKDLEQRVSDIEQQRLASTLEVKGVPKTPNENILEVITKISQCLCMDQGMIKHVKRSVGPSGHDGIIQVELNDPETAVEWARASKKNSLLVENIMGGVAASSAKSAIIIRRALTKHNKAVLWQAQQKLKPSYKYVWFQHGKVLARRSDINKPVAIRCAEDIERLLSTLK